MKPAYDVIVIGGGISGASFAYQCARRGLDTLLIEKSGALGGCIQSERLDGDFWFELGAHTCYNSYTQLLALLEGTLGLDALLPRHKLPYRLWAQGRLCSVRQELSLLRLMANLPRLLVTRKTGRSVEDYYKRLVGKHNYAHLFRALFAAVPCQNADQFSAELLFKSRSRRKDAPRSFTLRRGLQSIVEALSETPQLERVLDREAASVGLEKSKVTVRLADGTSIAGRFAALAVPAPVAARLLRDGTPELADALAQVQMHAARSVGVMVRRDQVALEPLAGIVPLDGSFFSAVSRDVLPDPTYRAFTFHFPEPTTPNEATAIVGRVLGVTASAVEHVVRREIALPALKVGHQHLVHTIDRLLAATPLFITGNYFGGLAIEDCVGRSVAEYGRLSSALG